MRTLVAMVRSPWQHRYLLQQLTWRDIVGRYRGSSMGLLWSVITPLLMLSMYSLVFGVILKSRWSETLPDGQQIAVQGQAEFAVILFSGLILHGFFAECLTKATGAITANQNLVKKVVFPLDILAWSLVGAALFHLGMGLGVLVAMQFIVGGGLHATALLLPIVLLPLIILALGIAWILAAAGVFVRDIGQAIPAIATVLLLLSPILFPSSLMPAWAQPIIDANPLTIPVTAIRAVLIWGAMPDWAALAQYSVVALLLAILGYSFFQRCRTTFADII